MDSWGVIKLASDSIIQLLLTMVEQVDWRSHLCESEALNQLILSHKSC